jgi:hypothetical protein
MNTYRPHTWQEISLGLIWIVLGKFTSSLAIINLYYLIIKPYFHGLLILIKYI